MAETIKVGMVSLGCPKNQCDAELMLAKIAKAVFNIVNEAGLADVVIINTCGFIQSAKEEAIEEIMEAISRKNDGINKKIIVTGCLAERYQKQMDEEFPEIDAVVGIAKNDDIVEIINSVMLDRRVVTFGDKLCHNMEGDKLQSTLPHYAYLRIADGCSNKCSYCAIPLIRGKMRSRKMENIIEEAKKFAENGVKELVIVAQDVTAYGIDLYKKYALPDLLKQLCKIDGIKWIRLLYCYPERMTDELIETIKTEDKVLNYIDIPIQHCNKEILRNMYRGGDEQSLRELFAKLRREIPGVVLRTTLITGFPGETEEHFEHLREFIEEVRFQHLGVFAYRAEEGTPAAAMPGQIPNAVKERRAAEAAAVAAELETQYHTALLGTTQQVLFEQEEDGLYAGHAMNYVKVYVQAADLHNEIRAVRITELCRDGVFGELE